MNYRDFIVEEITSITNRSENQTKFLLDLLDGNVWKLLLLELTISKLGIVSPPGSLEEINSVIDAGKRFKDKHKNFSQENTEKIHKELLEFLNKCL